MPISPAQLHPYQPDHDDLREKEKRMRERHKEKYDCHHRATDLKPLQPSDRMWISDNRSEGRVVRETNPRCYVVQTDAGTSRRNQRHLISLPQGTTEETVRGGGEQVSTHSSDSEPNPQQTDPEQVCTRSGRISRMPL